MISHTELLKRVEGYLKRTRNDKLVKSYPLEERGFYSIISGSRGDYGNRDTLAIVRGRFIDSIVYAVQKPGFVGEWCSWANNYDNCNHGKVEKIQVANLRENKTLIKALQERAKLAQEKADLEGKLKQVKKQLGGRRK